MKLINIKENKKLTITILSIVIAAVIFVPTMYSFAYLESIWDVYNSLGNVPVAFVNLDNSVTRNGKEYSLGKDIEKNLKSNKKVDWKFVSYKDAIDGVKGTKYYAVIEIPKNFSQSVASAQDGKFKTPQIIYIGNQGKNFVFSQMSSKVADSIKENVSSNVQKEISKSLVNSLVNVKVSIKDAADGTQQLQAGTEKLVMGSSQLSDGLNTAAGGSKNLQAGLQTIASGQDKIVSGYPVLIDGLNTLKSNLTMPNDKLPLLVNGASELNYKTGLIANGASEFDTSFGALTNGIKGADSVLNSELAAINNSNLSDEDKYKLTASITALNKISGTNVGNSSEAPLNKAAASAHMLSTNLNQLKGGTQGVSDGVSALSSGIEDSQNKAAAGVDKLIAGANTLQNGSRNVLTGLNTAVNKTDELEAGLDKLSSGSKALTSGIQTANDGTGKLNNGLNAGYNKINDNLKFNADNMSNFVSNPITLKDSSINSVKYYGEGLAPYFISLSLWIGAMFISVIISIVKKLNLFKSKLINSFAGSFIIGSGLVILQSCILSFTLLNGLKINPVSIPEFCVINAFISVAFFSVMYGLSYAIGILGGAVMFVVLILQLASSGGTFPIETAPEFFRIVNKVVPMSYSVSTLRMTISGINQSVLNHNILVILTFMVVFLAGGFIIQTLISRVRNIKKCSNSDSAEAA
ncbi:MULTISPECIES: YhgE/Pip family protein [Clostridium]|uniref:YhgE/Pip family protein n=1 Tax=Clostridium TaxID=1485 RepID=UPI000824C5EA|nr:MULTISPECIES: YhgE/Pip domain-containing protein [Clostridium]PJI07166.1 YhgE/Pip domain-containing protein [Clostridium sp. CT7]